MMRFLYRFKTVKGKQGFSLIECVVAIAVFSIMSMIVASLLAAAISLHRRNLSETRALKEQRDSFNSPTAKSYGTPVAPDPNTTRGDSQLIEFYFPGFTVGYSSVAVVAPSTISRNLELTQFRPTLAPSPPAKPPFKPMEVSFAKIVNSQMGNVKVKVSSRGMKALLGETIGNSLNGVCRNTSPLNPTTYQHINGVHDGGVCAVKGSDTMSSYFVTDNSLLSGPEVDYGVGFGASKPAIVGGTGDKFFINIFQVDIENYEKIDSILTSRIPRTQFMQINIPRDGTTGVLNVRGIIWGQVSKQFSATNSVTPLMPTTASGVKITGHRDNKTTYTNDIVDFVEPGTIEGPNYGPRWTPGTPGVGDVYYGPHPKSDYADLADALIVKRFPPPDPSGGSKDFSTVYGYGFFDSYVFGLVTEGDYIPDIPYWLGVDKCSHCCSQTCIDEGCTSPAEHGARQNCDFDGGASALTGCNPRICKSWTQPKCTPP